MKIDGQWFKDDEGRTLLLRGVNLGGGSKIPVKPGGTWIRDGFFDYRDVSFVGRPFPLEEADEHFSRLKEWGLTFERFIVTWEAIEHKGPGIYDEAYIDYIRAVLEKAAEYGIDVFIDPHQDVWSRWTGGDGAPAWTMELLGMDITKMHETGAAFVHNIHGNPIPHMIWDTNNYKFGTCTMFTLFFGGNDFAPKRMIDGIPVQEFLQSHYINAIKHLAMRLKGLPNVVGYGSLNEPQCGYIEFKDLTGLKDMRFIGEAAPGPLQSMVVADGNPQEVDRYKMFITGSKKIGRVTINPQGVSLWKDGYQCVWKEHGVWTDEGGVPRILKPDYFCKVGGRKVSFVNDYVKPFVNRFAREIRSVSPDAFVFIEAVPGKDFPDMYEGDAKDIVNASHWYDVLTIYTNSFSKWYTGDVYKEKLIIGKNNAAKSMVSQIEHIKNFSQDNLNGAPTLIGEFGLMFKINNGKAYRTGNYRKLIQALDSYYNAMDANLVSHTIWNYTSDNNNLHGDNWNEEDNSIFSRDQQDNPADINSGGRAIAGFCRPYARKTAGMPLSMTFRIEKRMFTFTFRPDEKVKAPTEIFVPHYQYPNGYWVDASSGRFEQDNKNQTLFIHDAKGETVTIKVWPRR
jgi:hypothetical protein